MRKFDLITIKFLSRVVFIHQQYFFDDVTFVVIKHLYIKPIYQVQIHFISIVPYIHNERTIGIQAFNFFLQCELVKFKCIHAIGFELDT